MPTHHLHLHAEPFSLIASNKKTIECRLFDDKRKKYCIGDSLVFINRSDESQTITAIIVGLHRKQIFRDLFLNPEIRNKLSSENTNELLDSIALYYSPEQQEKYGVIGIEFEITDKENC